MAPARKRTRQSRRKDRASSSRAKQSKVPAIASSSSSSEESLNNLEMSKRRCEKNLAIKIPQLNFTSDTNMTPEFGFATPAPLPTEPIDSTLGFHKMAGCESLIEEVKTRILFPILNKSFMERHGRSAPKGIMLHGPPGTGKTLFAKCLAAELSRHVTPYTNKYSFFMRRGTDIMSMYVGESEKRLREVFARAVQVRPSVLFFDEIDSLAPNRNKLSGNCASSAVVTTLLAEMDKVKRDYGSGSGSVIILFATNRLEAVDPALRRPGRCDVSIHFHPPSLQERKHILELYTKHWGQSSPSSSLLTQLAMGSNGFTGADLNKLCSEAFFACVKRTQQQDPRRSSSSSELSSTTVTVDETDEHLRGPKHKTARTLSTSVKRVSGSERVTPKDWTTALTAMGPSPTNVFGSYLQLLPVSTFIQPLISKTTTELRQLLKRQIPGRFSQIPGPQNRFLPESQELQVGGPNSLLIWNNLPKSEDILDALIIPSVLGSQDLSNLGIFLLNEEAMLQETKQMTINSIIDIINQAKRCSKPSVLYIPRIDKLAHRLAQSGHVALLRRLLFDTADKSVLVLATASSNTYQLPQELQPIFDGFRKCCQLSAPSEDERWEFFSPIFDELALKVASAYLGGDEASNLNIDQLKKKSSRSPNDLKLNTGLDKILDHTIEATDHDDMWSMITLHRELTNVCKRYELEASGATSTSMVKNKNRNQLKIIGRLLEDLHSVVFAYTKSHFEMGKK